MSKRMWGIVARVLGWYGTRWPIRLWRRFWPLYVLATINAGWFTVADWWAMIGEVKARREVQHGPA